MNDLLIDQSTYDKLLRHARTLVSAGDAEDLVQATLLSAYESLDSYDPDRSAPLTWLKVRMRSQANHLRAASRTLKRRPRRVRELQAPDPCDEVVAADGFTYCVRQLTPIEQEALHLVYVEGLTTADAASKVGITPATFRQRLSRTMRFLRKCHQERAL